MRLLPVLFVFALCSFCAAQGGSSAAVTNTITKAASVTIKAEKFETVRTQLADIATKSGGSLADAKTLVTPKGRRHGWFRLNIPAGNLDTFLSSIRSIGTLYGEQSTTTNREPELSELDLRRNGLQAHIDRLKGSLNSGRNMRGSDVLYLQERVFRAETDQALLLHQRKKIENSVSNASVIVTAFEKGEDITPPPGGVARFTSSVTKGLKEMIVGSADTIVSLVKFGIFLLVAIPIFRRFQPRVGAWFRKSVVGETEPS